MSSTLDAPKKAKTILLTTYKRDGAPVATPVSIAFDGGRAFFRSYDKRVLHLSAVDSGGVAGIAEGRG